MFGFLCLAMPGTYAQGICAWHRFYGIHTCQAYTPAYMSGMHACHICLACVLGRYAWHICLAYVPRHTYSAYMPGICAWRICQAHMLGIDTHWAYMPNRFTRHICQAYMLAWCICLAYMPGIFARYTRQAYMQGVASMPSICALHMFAWHNTFWASRNDDSGHEQGPRDSPWADVRPE